MTFPEIKLVDAPTSSATVLFDFNDLTATPAREVLADDFTIGVPEPVGDVDAVDPLYGDRTVSFTCRMTGTKPQVAAAQSTLARRLLAPGQGWLWVRMTPTSRLLFFRTYRPLPGDLSFDLVQTSLASKVERWQLEVELPCEPFAYGERVTQTTQTINSNPTSGTNPCNIVLASIVGDAPAPLRFAITSSETVTGPLTSMINVYSGTQRRPYQIQVGGTDGASVVGPDVTSVTNSAYAGGSYRSISFATTPTAAYRLEYDTGPVVPGRYKVMVRAVVTDATTTVRLQAIVSSLGGSPTGRQVTVKASLASTTVGTWVDLGELPIPARRPGFAADQGPDFGALLGLVASRQAGSGALNVDHIMLIPVDAFDKVASRTLLIDGIGPWSTSGRTLVVDGDTQDAWGVVNSSGVVLGTASALPGVFPAGVPGIGNVATIYFSAGTATNAETITRTLGVTVSYFPRFLYVGEA